MLTLFSSASPRVRLGDEENRGEKERLLGGVKKDDNEKRGPRYG
jgi:hypothetical protein